MAPLGRKRKKAIKIIAISLVVAISLLLVMFHSGVAVLERISGYVIYPILTATDAAADGTGAVLRPGFRTEERGGQRDGQSERFPALADQHHTMRKAAASGRRTQKLKVFQTARRSSQTASRRRR